MAEYDIAGVGSSTRSETAFNLMIGQMYLMIIYIVIISELSVPVATLILVHNNCS